MATDRPFLAPKHPEDIAPLTVFILGSITLALLIFRKSSGGGIPRRHLAWISEFERIGEGATLLPTKKGGRRMV